MDSIKDMARTGNNYGLVNWTPINELIAYCPSSLGCHYSSSTDKLVRFPSPRNGWKTFADSISDNIYKSNSVEGLKFPGLEKLLNNMKSQLITIGDLIQQKENLQSHILVKTFQIAIQKQSNRKGWESWINTKLNEYYDFSNPDKLGSARTRVPVTKALVADGKPAAVEHFKVWPKNGFDFTYDKDSFTYIFEITQSHLKAGQAIAVAKPFPDGSSGSYPIYKQSSINYNNVNTVKGYSHAGTTHKVHASVVPKTNKLDPVLAKLFNIPTDGTGIPELTADLSICAQ